MSLSFNFVQLQKGCWKKSALYKQEKATRKAKTIQHQIEMNDAEMNDILTFS